MKKAILVLITAVVVSVLTAFVVWYNVPNPKLVNSSFDKLYLYDGLVNRKIGIIGKVFDISNRKLVIKNLGPRLATLDTNLITKIRNEDGALLKLGDLKTGDNIFVIIRYVLFKERYEIVL